jgi:two-component system, OmpR family, phosphate regulon sensor histidine kinase PhoR
MRGRLGRAANVPERTTLVVLSLLLLGVLVPTAGVLWFVNETARSEAASARQRVIDAYRGQLRLIRGRIESYWSERAAVLTERAAGGRPSDFKGIVSERLADSVILVDDRGAALYPDEPREPPSEPERDDDAWRAARALETTRARWREAAAAYRQLAAADGSPSRGARAAQAEIRCLVQGGDHDAAVRAIQRSFVDAAGARAVDAQGRLIAADELLLSLHLLDRADRRFTTNADRLAAMLNDYDSVHMPAAQRLFVMNEVAALTADRQRERMPTHDAETLAAAFLDTNDLRLDDRGFRPSRIPNVWTFTPKGRRVIALYRAETIAAALQGIVDQQNVSPAVRFAAIPPGGTTTDESIAAGALLPDWQVSFAVADPRPLNEAARRRIVTYAWTGFLVIAWIAASAVLIGSSFQRQMRLARLKTDLVAAVSHELKTPLASMRLLVDALLEDRQLDPLKTREYLQLVAAENLRLSRLIDNFLTFSRIERNRRQLTLVDHDPSAIAGSAVEAMRERLQPPACRFNVDIEPGLPLVRADADALVTALLNLLDNAYKYTPADKRIALSVVRDRSQVAFVVRDNGIGIGVKEQKRIFRRFYQVDRRLARERGGVGLGLSIVAFVARAHGGTIAVASEPGHGSTFTLSVPCRAEVDGAAA